MGEYLREIFEAIRDKLTELCVKHNAVYILDDDELIFATARAEIRAKLQRDRIEIKLEEALKNTDDDSDWD